MTTAFHNGQWGENNVILDLKSVFLNDGFVLHREYSFTMSKEDSSFVTPVVTEIKAENRAGIVRLLLATVFDLCKPCDRCGAEVTRKFQYTFEHFLAVSLSGDQNDDYIETPDYTLDIDELLRSDILLEMPSKYLCREDCKGLCPKCGADLNLKDCGCVTKNTDPRFEVLQRLMN